MQGQVVKALGLVLATAIVIGAPGSTLLAQTDYVHRSARILGEVRSDSGRPLPMAQIAISRLNRGVVSDSLGRFSVASLPAGTHRVTVHRLGYRPSDTTVTLAEGQTVAWHPTLRLEAVRLEVVGVGPRGGAQAANAAVGRVDSVATGAVTLDTTLSFDYARFGVRLLAAAVRKSPDSNRVLSPLSAGQALALAMAASKDSTTIVMARELGLGGMDQKTLAKRTQWFNRSLAKRKDLTLTIANALWVDTSETLQPEFAASALEFYDASVREAPLRSKSFIPELNRWADSATRGRIKRVRDKPFADSVKAVLTNAVYLKGTWLTPFEKTLTNDKHFTTALGERRKVPTMHRDGALAYRRERGFQVVRIPYQSGLTAMYIVLPDEGVPAAQIADSLDRYGWPTPSPRTDGRDVALALPRFHVEQRTDLKPPLSAIGMGIIFDDSRADFGGLFTQSANRPAPCPPISAGRSGGMCTRVRISDATQNVFLDVDEVGTEAAAVTVLAFEVVVTSAVVKPPPIPFVVDRPFFFAIRDERTGTSLFAGYVADPRR